MESLIEIKEILLHLNFSSLVPFLQHEFQQTVMEYKTLTIVILYTYFSILLVLEKKFFRFQNLWHEMQSALIQVYLCYCKARIHHEALCNHGYWWCHKNKAFSWWHTFIEAAHMWSICPLVAAIDFLVHSIELLL